MILLDSPKITLHLKYYFKCKVNVRVYIFEFSAIIAEKIKIIDKKMEQ